MLLQPRQASPTSCYGSTALWIFLSFSMLYVALGRGHFWTTDEIAVFQQTRSLWERGNLAIDPVRNTIHGRDGHFYAPYGAGQSILALPLYGLGKLAGNLLDAAGFVDLRKAIAGPVINNEYGWTWGGQVEIFFVNLFNCFTVAALVALFFCFTLRLGAKPIWALVSALVLGLATHVAGFGSSFFQHGTEALLLLWTFYFLYCNSRTPSLRLRLLAGLCAAILLPVRISAAIHLPALTLYLFYQAWSRDPEANPAAKMRRAILDCIPFALMVTAGIACVGLVNYSKFDEFTISGSYGQLVPFNNPILLGLYGYLFSPGESILLFSPILFLAPFYFPRFASRYRAETVVILVMAVSQLCFYSSAYLWHGQWYFGPRYLMPMVPLLLLPLANWLEDIHPAAWLAVAPLIAGGVLIEALHFAVNTSYIYRNANYDQFIPPFGFLFIPESSQIVLHFKALFGWDNNVDLWLVTIWESSPVRIAATISTGLLAAVAVSVFRLARRFRQASEAFSAEIHPEFGAASPLLIRLCAVAWFATILWVFAFRIL